MIIIRIYHKWTGIYISTTLARPWAGPVVAATRLAPPDGLIKGDIIPFTGIPAIMDIIPPRMSTVLRTAMRNPSPAPISSAVIKPVPVTATTAPRTVRPAPAARATPDQIQSADLVPTRINVTAPAAAPSRPRSRTVAMTTSHMRMAMCIFPRTKNMIQTRK